MNSIKNKKKCIVSELLQSNINVVLVKRLKQTCDGTAKGIYSGFLFQPHQQPDRPSY